MSQRHRSDNPFPGLRSFTAEEDHLFFGREEQTMELLHTLGARRFVAVVGTSGSGKSSLVRCGLLSQLLGGKMLQAGTRWEVAVTHPGAAPMSHLAEALLEAELYDGDEEDAKARLLATLSRSHFGLVEAIRQAQLGKDTNFVLVVDQFEEIFRYHQGGAAQRDAANEFVSMLLQAAAQTDVPIYIVLTMRSDFIGDCAQFENLAEAVNRGEYLIPRMTREQFKQSIEGPIRVAGGTITPRLLQRLLNDLGEQADQLPCLQHALMRTWDQWKRSSREGEAAGSKSEIANLTSEMEPEPLTPALSPSEGAREKASAPSAAPGRALDLEDYDAIGRMNEALSRHADELYGSLGSDRARQLCAAMFKAITMRESENRGIRRPQTLGRLGEIVEVPAAELMPLIEAYRQPGVTFLMPPPAVPLTNTTVIDISHESLMRVWVRLRDWVEEEAASVGIFHRLAESATLHEKGKAGLYRDPELGIALSWREETHVNAAWADQYGGHFGRAMGYLDRSREAAEVEEKEREAARQRELERAKQFAETQAKVARLFKRFAGSLAVGLALAVALTIWAFKLRSEANRLRTKAEQQTDKTQEALAASKQEQGKALLILAKGRLEQNDHFGAKLIAGSAIGFSGFGREQQPAGFAATNLDLLGPGSPERGEVARLLRGQPDFMPIWSSPKVNQHGWWISAVLVTPDGRSLISSDWTGTINVWNLTGGELLKTVHVPMEGEQRLTGIDLSADGRWLAAPGLEGTIRIWDTSTWEQKYLLTNHADTVVLVRFSPDGKTMASASQEGAVKLWETGGFRLKASLNGLPATDEMGSLSFHPEGSWLLATTRVTQRSCLWNLRTGDLLKPGLDLPGELTAFSPDGRWVVSLTNQNQAATLTLLRWGLEPGTPQLTVVTNRVLNETVRYGLTFSPDSQTVACLGDFGTVFRLSVPTLGELPRIMAGDSGVGRPLAFTPDGAGLIYAGSTIRYYEMPSGKPKWIPESHAGGARAAVFSPDGRLFASGGADGDVRLWETATGRTRSVLHTGQPRVRELVFQPEGTLLAAACWDGTIHLWETATGAERGVLRGHEGGVVSLAAHPAGEGLASGGKDGSVRFWSWDGRETHRIDGRGKEVLALAFSPDGRTLAFAQDREIELWDLAQQKFLQPSLKGHASVVGSLAFSPDGALLVSGGAFYAHGETRLWDWRAGTSLQRWYDPGDDGNYHESRVAFTPDGRQIVRGLSGQAEWNEIGREEGISTRVAVLNKRPDQRGRLALSPDGRLLVTTDDYGLELWDVSSGKETLEWSNPDGDEFSASGVDLSPDGQRVATGTRNGLIRIWELRTGRLLYSFKAEKALRGDFDPTAYLPFGHYAQFIPWDDVASVRFSPDGQRLYAVNARSGLITAWEFKDGWREVASAVNPDPVFQMELSSDGALLAAASFQAVRLWDARKLGPRRLGKITSNYANSIALHPALPLLALTSDGLRVFDLADPNKPREDQHWPAKTFLGLKYSPDGKYLASLEWDGPERILDAKTGKQVQALGVSDKTRSVCDFSPDGHWFAVGNQQKVVRIWDLKRGELVAVLPGHSDWVNHVQFTPDSRRLVTVCSQKVRVWDLERVLHESLDYASHLKAFKIDGQEVGGIFASTGTTNLQRAVFQSFHQGSPQPLLSFGGGAGERAEQSKALFWDYYRVHNLASARAALVEVESAGPSGIEHEALVGLCRTVARGNFLDRRFPLAHLQIEMALALAPKDFENWQTKAEMLQEEGDYAGALSAVERAIQLAPQASESWATKAALLRMLSNGEAAVQAWGKAVDLAPDQRKDSYVAMAEAGKPAPQIPDARGWIRLFDGPTLSGWTAPDSSQWEMRDGEVRGQGAKSHLFSPFIYTNLEFRAEVRLARGGRGGMFFRAACRHGINMGYEAQADNTPDAYPDPQRTGSLSGFQPVKERLVEDETWFTQHVVAIGNRIIIKVNDRIVTDFVDEKHTYAWGHLALEQWGTSPKAPGTVVTYRHVVVKPLSDDAQAAWTEARKDVPEIQ